MVPCAHCCSCGSRGLVSVLAASFISAPCPDFVYENLTSPDVVQLALFSHGGARGFLSLVPDDSVLLRVGVDHQFRALWSASHFHSDPSWTCQVLEDRTLSSESDKIRETIPSSTRYQYAIDIIPVLCLSKHNRGRS